MPAAARAPCEIAQRANSAAAMQATTSTTVPARQPARLLLATRADVVTIATMLLAAGCGKTYLEAGDLMRTCACASVLKLRMKAPLRTLQLLPVHSTHLPSAGHLRVCSVAIQSDWQGCLRLPEPQRQ